MVLRPSEVNERSRLIDLVENGTVDNAVLVCEKNAVGSHKNYFSSLGYAVVTCAVFSKGKEEYSVYFQKVKKQSTSNSGMLLA